MRGRIGTLWLGIWALAFIGCDDAGDNQGGDAAPPPACAEGDEEPCFVAGECAGVRRCVNGRLGLCEALEDICDNVDNDCDGTVDEDFPGVGLSCTVGVGACRTEGRIACTFDGSGAICDALPAAAEAESCDGLDNDCDGATDEEVPIGELCDTGADGVCNEGQTLCADGMVLCSEVVNPVPEICDGLDNDCDGRTDEGDGGGPLQQPCYDGPDGTEGVGTCTGGFSSCVDGAFGGCDGQVLPGDEICDAADNDCNGQVDDAADGCECTPGELADCYPGPDGTAGVGLCQVGVARCLEDGSGVDGCQGAIVPTAEVCDGLDNDCNGVVDDAPGVGDACVAGVGGCAAAGTRVCDVDSRSVVCDAVPGPEAIEVCNGIDDDCDGLIDDVDGAGLPCEAGVGACAAPGVQTCDLEAGELTCRADLGLPAIEVCNGIDDDCNGVVDDVVGNGDACSAGVGACAADGTQVCNVLTGELECDAEAGAPGEEVCSGVDDDCNGIIDDAPGVGEACTNGVGACAADGLGQCGDGEVVCDAEPGEPADEVCNEIDDDCDGRTDEAGVCPEICGDGLDNDDDGAADCDDEEDCARDPFCAYASCQAALDDGQGRSGIYLIRTADGGVADLYCDMATDGGGWTLVASTAGAMFDDQGVAYYPDLTTLAPESANAGVFNGLDLGSLTDIRFACRAALAPANAPMQVDLSFYSTPWYVEFAEAANDAQSCFSEGNGAGFDEPPPRRRNNLTGTVIGANTGWAGGTLEGEDFCEDTLDFTVDFNDRGMKSNISDGTDWGEDNGRLKCGNAPLNSGQWFIFVRETEERPPEICDDGIDDDQDGAVDCADFDCVEHPVCADLIGEIRLADGFGEGTGRVEVRYNGRWGTVCDDNFGLTDADIVCQQLGLPGARTALEEFGGGTGTIWMDEVACAGDEERLIDCPALGLGTSDCNHDDDVGVICLGPGQCRDDAQCTGGAVCLDGECFGGEICDDGEDNDEDGLVDCDDDDCAPADVCAECLRDDMCAADEICEARVCIAGCRLDEQCGVNEICDDALLTCVPGCRDDETCGAGNICIPDVGCRAGCRVDGDCGEGQICDAEALECVAGCRDDAGCGLDNICEAEQCVPGCRDDAGCSPGNICEGDLCVPGCREDANCGVGSICVDNGCVEGCRDDENCGPGAICENQLCEAGCRDDAGCPDEGDVCIDGQCGPLPAETCDNGVDDDRDGDVDCDDADCIAGPACPIALAAQGEEVVLDQRLDAGDGAWDVPGDQCAPGDGGAHPFDVIHFVNDTDRVQRVDVVGQFPPGPGGVLHHFAAPFDGQQCLASQPLEGIEVGPGELLVITASSAQPDDRFGLYRVRARTQVFESVDFCRLQFPENINDAPGTSTMVFGRLYEEGLTDRTPANDPSPQVRAAVGYGPPGSDPAGPDWVWTDAAPNPGYAGDEPNNDEYFADLVTPDPPVPPADDETPDPTPWDYAFRFSVDGGNSVTYCDRDGNGTTLEGDAAGGYDPEQSGVMISDPVLPFCAEACADAFACGLGIILFPDEATCYAECPGGEFLRPAARCMAENWEPPGQCGIEVAQLCEVLGPVMQ